MNRVERLARRFDSWQQRHPPMAFAVGVITTHLLRHAQAVAGLFGLVLGPLAWLGLQATVVVFTVEADVVRARHLWPRSLVPPPLTDADKAYYTDAVRAETQRPELRLDIQYVPADTSTARHDAD